MNVRTNFDRLRDRFAYRVCNFILNHVATPFYRDKISDAIARGLK